MANSGTLMPVALHAICSLKLCNFSLICQRRRRNIERGGTCASTPVSNSCHCVGPVFEHEEARKWLYPSNANGALVPHAE